MNQITTPNFLASYGQGLQINQAQQEIGNRNALTQAMQAGDMGAARNAYSALDPVGAYQAAQPAPRDPKATMAMAGQLTRAVLGAPPEMRGAVYAEALEMAGGMGMDVSGLPQQYDEQSVAVMDRLFNMPEQERTEFERQLAMIPEGPERDRAVRIALKLEPGATNQEPKSYAPDEYERYVSEEQSAGRQPLSRLEFKQAAKGNGITIGPDGTVQIGGQAGDRFGRAAENALDLSTIDTAQMGERLASIGSLVEQNPEYLDSLTIEGKLKSWKLGWQDRLSPESLTDEQADYLIRVTETRAEVTDNLNRYIKEITGAAMGVQEAARIISTMPNDDDSPRMFLAKLRRVQERTQLALDRLELWKAQGGVGKPEDMLSLGKMEELNKRSDTLNARVLRGEMTEDEAARTLAKEFGI